MKEPEIYAAKKAEMLALRYLSYSSRTEREVVDKLRSYGEFDDTDILTAIEALKKYGYIDDRKFAESFSISKYQSRLDGPSKIKTALVRRGISSKIADEALNSLQSFGVSPEAENAARLITKKLRGKEEISFNEKTKIYTYLMRKGFSASAIKEAFKIIGGKIDEADFCEPDNLIDDFD